MTKLGYKTNEHGVRISLHKCEACGQGYSVCPAVDTDDPTKTMNRFCTTPECPSYNEACDVDLLFDEGREGLIKSELGSGRLQ